MNFGFIQFLELATRNSIENVWKQYLIKYIYIHMVLSPFPFSACGCLVKVILPCIFIY